MSDYTIKTASAKKVYGRCGIIQRMKNRGHVTLAFILPFATWMGLMFLLPPTASDYAIRSAATLGVGSICLFLYHPQPAFHFRNMMLGILVGILVCVLWILIPVWPFPEPVAPNPSPYAPTVCGWSLTIAKLIGSAFIIAPVEEVFFRSFLYRWLIARDFLSVPQSRFDLSAFLWMILLFTLEHDRPVAAAITAALYGLLAIRFGIGSAIAAHVTTNLLLGLHVIYHNAWQFW